MKFLENITPREYQQKIFETCVKKNCLVVLPTGLGKTLIALMLTIKRMEEFPGQKVVFLAPTRPLAEQHIKSFKKHLPELFGDMQLFTGKVPAQDRKKIWKTADIIFSTPQCVGNDLKKNLYNLNEVCLLIEDEAHRCIKNYSYNYVAQRYIQQSQNPRIIGLTASPGSDTKKIKDICINLSIEEVELRTRNSDDVKKYLQKLEFEKIIINFPAELQEVRVMLKELFDEYIEQLRKRNVLHGFVSKITLLELQRKISRGLSFNNQNFNYMLAASACAQAIKLQHALELLETQTLESFNKYLKNLFNQAAKKQSKGVQRLVAKEQFNFIYSRTQELIAKKFEHPKLEKLKEIIKNEIQKRGSIREDLDNSTTNREGGKFSENMGVGGGLSKSSSKKNQIKIIVFTQFRDTATKVAKTLNEIKTINAKVFVGQTKRGEGSDATGLSQKEQKAIIEDFSNGKINILVATSIGEEGLDIPEVNAVIFYEPVPSAIRAIQRAGRTARLMKGKLIVLITKGTRDESFYYASRSREKKMHSAISTIKDELAEGIKFDEQRRLE